MYRDSYLWIALLRMLNWILQVFAVLSWQHHTFWLSFLNWTSKFMKNGINPQYLLYVSVLTIRRLVNTIASRTLHDFTWSILTDCHTWHNANTIGGIETDISLYNAVACIDNSIMYGQREDNHYYATGLVHWLTYCLALPSHMQDLPVQYGLTLPLRILTRLLHCHGYVWHTKSSIYRPFIQYTNASCLWKLVRRAYSYSFKFCIAD